MCGRFTQSSKIERYRRLFGLDEAQGGDMVPRWNVAPGTCIWLCRQAPAGRLEMVTLWWGLVPHWAKDLKGIPHPINARAETVAEKPFFRDAWRRGHRCLIPAEGFYEWRAEGKAKLPYFIHRRDGEPMAFAGLWDTWQRPGAPEHPSCTILVTDANATLQPIHDRMPVIIAAGDFGRWLDPASDTTRLQSLLRPFPADELEAYRVSTAVNNSRNDGPDLVLPAGG